jgi:hypothetical protein
LEFDSVAIDRMSSKFEITTVISKVWDMSAQPFDVGVALGTMLYYVVPLVSTHVENGAGFQNKTPGALAWASGFVEAVDKYTAHLRVTDGCSEPANEANDGRKGRRAARKFKERYMNLVGAAYKDYVGEQLCDMFQCWDKEQTQLFNKGVDKALTGVQWVVYPGKNVVLQPGDTDWAIWLRGQCEELGMAEARAGRQVLEDM